MTAAMTLLTGLRSRGVRVESPAPGRIRLVVPPGALSDEEIENLRPRKPELLAALAAEQAPLADWIERRTRGWLQHLLDHDRDNATLAFARELALDDWRLAQTGKPGVA